MTVLAVDHTNTSRTSPDRASPGSGAADEACQRFEHPHVVLRVAAMPFSATLPLSSGAERRHLDRLEQTRSEAMRAAAEACDLLEAAIGIDDLDQEKRRPLLKAKRNLFNTRVSKLDGAGDWLESEFPAIARAARSADALIADLREAEEGYASLYAEKAEEAGEALREACRAHPDFLKAVAFSAPAVTADLDAAKDNPKKYTGKRGRNLNQALFNYFTRATVKVSPLSFFTPILVGRWSDGNSQFPDLDGRAISGETELSRRALDHVLATLARNLAFWGGDHKLVLNPTARLADGHVDFNEIHAKGGSSGRTWGVYQPQQRLAINPRLAVLFQHFQQAGTKGSTLRELIAALPAPPFPADPNQLASYVANALRVGLLLPAMPLFEQEDLPAYLSDLLAKRLPATAELFDRLIEASAAYGATPYAERSAASGRIHALYAELCESLKIEVPDDRRSPLFYEDCQIGGDTPRISRDYLGTAIEDMHGYADLFPLLDYNHIVQAVSAALFRKRYGDDAKIMAIDCVEEIANEAQQIAQRMTPLPLDEQEAEISKISPTAASLIAGKRAFFTEILARMEAGEDLVLDEAFIETMRRYIPEEVRRRSTSYTVIGQTDDGGRDGKRFVLNRLYSGHSMLMSRFLRYQPEEEASEVRGYLRGLSGGGKPVEIPGVFGFNANIHPRFVDAELDIPGRRANYSDTEKVSVETMKVGYDPDLDRLAFYDGDGDKLSVMYFGFLNMMVLPNLYQVLGRMNLQGLILDLWQDLLFAGLLGTTEITVLPRVTFGETVVSRRSWFVPEKEMPDPELEEAEYFRAMHALFSKLGPRNDYFVRLVAAREDFFGSGEDDEVAMADTTDFKPAYLSLDMPMTLASLRRRLRRRNRGVLLQEVLPEIGEGGQEWRGEAHACEYQFEISRNRE